MGDETVDDIEAKYISGLSTVMVATIQEAKDRISQIEYIFCSQLYPNFQTKSKTFEKVYSEARIAACDAWKEREKALLSQVDELKVENERVKAENQALVKDKENLFDKKLMIENERVKAENQALVKDKENLSYKKLMIENERVKCENLALIKEKEDLSKELDKLIGMPLMVKSLEDYIAHLKRKSKSRSKVVQDARELHRRLVQVLQVKGFNELCEDEINMLIAEVKSLKTKADFGQEELVKKTLVTENLLKKLECLSTEAADSEMKLSSLEEEKQRLKTRLQVFEENVGRLEELLRHKTDEFEQGRMVLQEKLTSTEKEMLECKRKLTDHEKEKTMHMQVKHGSYLSDLEALRHKSEEKSLELAMERKKRKEAFTTYKNLKSQYNFLCKRFGLTTDSAVHQSQLEDETNQLGQHDKPDITNSLERKHPEAERSRNGTGSSINCEKESMLKTVQTPTTFISPMIRSPGVRSYPTGAKSPHLSGSKRPASIWRDTRSRQSPGGQDPHDDFLDTPIENVKRVAVEEKHVPNGSNKDDSDEETQDMNPKPSPSRQRIQVADTSKKGFKHVESVRKKADRENLKGVECKQCKKFYDAVHPENDGNGKSLRCEHHEGVSRHRYKYAPPMTPEGFWNIGFESEM